MGTYDDELGESSGNQIQSARPHSIEADILRLLWIFTKNNSGVKVQDHVILLRALINWPVSAIIIVPFCR